MTQGVLQGEILSPLIFAIFLNDIWSYFLEAGLNIDGSNDNMILAFADDLVILCDSSIDLTRKLNALSQYC